MTSGSLLSRQAGQDVITPVRAPAALGARNATSSATSTERMLRTHDGGGRSRGCACTGARVCALCEAQDAPRAGMVLSPSEIAARQRDERVDYEWSIDDARLVGTGGADARTDARAARFALHVVRDVLDEQAEAALVRSINAGGEWTPSQSGRRKQDFGPKVGFKSRRLSAAHFGGFPPYARALFERVCEACAGLDGFEAAEMAVLEYEESRGACIDYHIDDAWVWGDPVSYTHLTLPTTPYV